ncbi:uncharacterized protein PFL1_05772 [Pseudozyma flocculosa PF-1]|uniref:RGS domain-containing protein n=1 Tax=Pseudozyma flocculosa PF-1 TaxID=1277687 RepID=A0A061H3A6_9BASI|nr:uncharacterized protein PFL1_05772 [Pseudozyma flocculosa PF-1]EPQ26794.1 hypothetical protein PFL1_05772 [Pseudozyma flocculosa PF-1]
MAATAMPVSPVHDVFADNRSENLFGWVQPDEWDTVAGPNTDLFLRGHRGASRAVPPHRRAASASGPTTAPHLGDASGVVKGAQLGVTLIDIIHGRSCRPISLLDLRTFLLLQRQPHRRVPGYAPASDMALSTLPDLDLDLLSPLEPTHDAPAEGLPNTHVLPSQLVRDRTEPRQAYDEVDALDFLVAFERYKKRFRDLPKAERMRSPDSLTCRAAVDAYHRRRIASMEGAMSFGDGVDAPQASEHVDLVDEGQSLGIAALRGVQVQDVGLDPASQPLRRELDRIVSRYIRASSRSSQQTPASMPTRILLTRAQRKSHKGSSDSFGSTVVDAGVDEKGKSAATGSPSIPARLQWTVDVGLVSQDHIDMALAEARLTTHPDTLAPLADAISAYLSAHVVPYFFISVAKNLSRPTSKGRLAVGLACTVIATVFTVLLLLKPSPLSSSPGGAVDRWWRLCLTPLWAAALGYVLAYRTGVCVWLTLRGNREPDEDEEREREEIRSRFSDDAAGFSFAEVEADAELRDDDVERKTNRWMAPELASLLRTGRLPRRSESAGDVRAVPAATAASIAVDAPPAVVGTRMSISGEGETRTPLAETPVPFSRSKSVDFGAHTRSIIDSQPSSPRLERQPRSILNGRLVQPRASEDGPATPALMRGRRVPLLPLTLGVVKSPARSEVDLHARAIDSAAHSPVLTRDALLFDPALAQAVQDAAGRRPSMAVHGGGGGGGGGATYEVSPLAPAFILRRPSAAVDALPISAGSALDGAAIP